MTHRFILFFLVITTSVFAQDQIFKKDNTKVDAKILEVNPTEVKYKLFNYLDGPTIIISKSEVALIIYQNGTHEVFNTPEKVIVENPYYDPQYDPRAERLRLQQARDADLKKLYTELTSTKQVVAINFLEVLNGGFGVSYMREFAHNYLNVYIPIAVGFTEPWSSNNMNIFLSNYGNVQQLKFNKKTIDVGLGVHFQTNTTRMVTHFVGPMLGMAQFNGSYKSSSIYYDPTLGYDTYGIVSHTFVANNYYFLINNGLLFRITKNFNFMMYAAVGYQTWVYQSNDPGKYNNNYYNPYNQSGFPINKIKLGFNFGYRF